MSDQDILGYDPWSDDSGYRVLDNRMVTTRYQHDCAICFQPIAAGTRVRSQREAYDGRAMTFRFCPECCNAFAALRHGDPDGLKIEQRRAIGSLYGWARQRTSTAQSETAS